jgi:predicted dehydrogenase
MVEASLQNGKHVMCEKPMTMDVKEADKLINLAKQNKKIFYVMHNFQYTMGIKRLSKIIAAGDLGELVSFYEFQLTNKSRRLPAWYNELPLGLFFDEAPHFMYLLEKFGGKLKIEDAYAQFDSDKNINTPILMNVALRAGKYPASIFLNFDSPVCEWYFVVCGSRKIAYYDLFKDILVVLPSDNEHRASDVIRNSWKMTYQYWSGFIKNGFRMLSGNLLYGHKEAIESFVEAVATGKNIDGSIDSQRGKATVGYMTEIVKTINMKRGKNE